MEFISLVLLCKQAWHAFIAVQNNLLVKLTTTGKKVLVLEEFSYAFFFFIVA